MKRTYLRTERERQEFARQARRGTFYKVLAQRFNMTTTQVRDWVQRYNLKPPVETTHHYSLKLTKHQSEGAHRRAAVIGIPLSFYLRELIEKDLTQ